MADHSNSIVGQKISDRYQVISEVGSGGYAAVYIAKHLSLNNLVALKVLHGHLASNDADITRFRREAEATSRLKHYAIATIYDFGQLADGRPYIVMEYLHGQSLSNIIDSEAPMPASRLVPLFLECCDALDYAHRRGLLHRDIKPDNIFVIKDMDGAEHAKLLDFGLAKAIYRDDSNSSSLTETGHLLGTPWYMSPEQCLTKPLDNRSDLYSLGCSLYEALSGKRPFAGKNLYDTMYIHINRKPPKINSADEPPVVLPSLEAVVLKLLEKSPNDRYATASELKQALTAAMAVHSDTPDSGKQQTPQISSLPPLAMPAPVTVRPGTVAGNNKNIKPRVPKQHSQRKNLQTGMLAALLIFALGFAILCIFMGSGKTAGSSGSAREAKARPADSATLDNVAVPSDNTSGENTNSPDLAQPFSARGVPDAAGNFSRPDDLTDKNKIEELEAKIDTLVKENAQNHNRPAIVQPTQTSRMGSDSNSSLPLKELDDFRNDESSRHLSKMGSPLPNDSWTPNDSTFIPTTTVDQTQNNMPREPEVNEPRFLPPPIWRPGMPPPPPRGFQPPHGWPPGPGRAPEGEDPYGQPSSNQ